MKSLFLTALTLTIAFLTPSVTGAQEAINLSDEDIEAAHDFLSYLDYNPNSQKVVITDKKGLANYLENNDVAITVEEAKRQLKQLNDAIRGKNGDERQNQLDNSFQQITNEALPNNSSGISTMSLSCSDAMTIIGFLHSGCYTTLAQQ